MKARMPFRSLLTTTSVAALLVASSGAYAAGTTINSGPLSTPITADTDFVSIETVLENDVGIDGLVISGAATDVSEVTNTSSGSIDISDSDTAHLDEGYDGRLVGIYVTDGADVYDTISNQGAITVEASSSGLEAEFRDAAGIRIDGDASASRISNSGAIAVTATNRNIGMNGSQSEEALDARASAFGVDSSGSNFGFYNSGSVDATANTAARSTTADTALSHGAAESLSFVTSSAYAVGAGFYSEASGVDEEYNLPNVVGDITLNNGAITVRANATGTVNANADAAVDLSCDISESGCDDVGSALADAYGSAEAIAYGVRADGQNARTGSFENYGVIDVVATSRFTGLATASSDDEDTHARSGAHRDYYDIDEDDYYTYNNHSQASATGVALDALEIGGDVENHSLLFAGAQAYSAADARADGTDDEATAESGNYASAIAKGVDVDTLLLHGGFSNDGRIEAASGVHFNNNGEEETLPVFAGASAYDEAAAGLYLNGTARATGVEINAHSMAGDFYAQEGNEEGDGIFATATATSSALASAVVDASSSGFGEAYAQVETHFDVRAAGIDLEIGNLSGQFVNDGLIEVLSDVAATQRAYVDSADEGYARADAEIYSTATGIRFEYDGEGDGATISGNIINRGSIDITSNALLHSTAEAVGEGSLWASAGGEVYSSATGINFDVEYVQDNFVNDGSILIAANAKNVVTANATVDDESGGDAFASAGGVDSPGAYVAAEGTGLDLFFDRVSGHITNAARIQVDVQAMQSSFATADANDADAGDAAAFAGGDLSADSTGIYLEINSAGTGLEWVDDVEKGDGTFTNRGVVDVNSTGNVVLAAHAYADDGSAMAVAEFYGSEVDEDSGDVEAKGIFITDNSEGAYFEGSIGNFDEVRAESRLNVDIEARATVDEGDEEDTRAAALAGGTYSSFASGFNIEYADVEGEVYNADLISGAAYVTSDVSAYANSDDSPAYAVVGADFSSEDEFFFVADDASYLGARAQGLTLYDSRVDNNVTNAGGIFAGAGASGKFKADAKGDEQARASLDAHVEASATGIRADGVSFGEGLVNEGLVYTQAQARQENIASANGDMASAEIGRDNESWTNAVARGIQVDAESSFSFVNVYDGEDFDDFEEFEDGGAIYAGAAALSQNYAYADGFDGADARVDQGDAASAYGVDISYSSEDYSADVLNQGLIVAFAIAGSDTEDARQEAYAESDGGDADARVDHTAQAMATGVRSQAASFTNSGLIGADARAYSVAYAHADANEGEATADASASADAEGTGLYLVGDDINSTFDNSGTISALVQAYAYAVADVEGSESSYADAEATADAKAYGAKFLGESYFATITNHEGGLIEAHATAEARETQNDDYDTGSSSAEAVGIKAAIAGFVTLQNDGTINATASAEEYAFARGIELSDISYPSLSGEIINTGTISASAFSDDAYATAIHYLENVAVSLIRNTGTISAAVYGDSEEGEGFSGEDGRAIAIDIRGASMPVTIEQLDGEIIGDVRMENALSDYVSWSGGTITGDIYGDQEDGDYLNVFAGEDDTFNYHGTVDGLDVFAVNGSDYIDAVSLRLTNVVRNVNSFNVGPNATVNLGTHANVSTGDLNLDASSMLVYDLTSDGVNGVINTGTADLGGATVKANFIDPWLPDSQVYRIINWEGDSETRFGSVISSSLLEKVIAQYGEDGVDLLATRLKFADLTGLEDDATSFGRALDRIFDDINPESDLGQAILLLIQLTPDQFAYEMSQIAGQQIADVQHVTLSQLGSLIHVIQTQINEARTNLTSNAGTDGMKVSFGSDKLRVTSGSDMPDLSGVSAGDETVKGDWSAWARVFGDWSKLDGSGTAQGFTSTTGGAVIGGDYAINDALTLGIAGGYQTSNLEFGTGGEGDVDGWSVTAYGDYRFGNAYIDALIGYSVQSYDMDRYLTVLGTSYVANSSYDGSSIIGAVEAGYTFTVAPKTTLTPFVGLNGNQTKTDASVETGAGIWNLAYADRSETRIDTVLGARVSKSFIGSDGLAITPTFELGWKHGFGSDAPTANAALAGTPGTQFQIFGSPTSRDTAIVGAAVQVQMSEKVDLYVQYNGQYSSDYADNTASLRLRWKF